MMKKILVALVVGLALLGGGYYAYAEKEEPKQEFVQSEQPQFDTITVRTKDGKDLKFDVELATTSEQQAKGLMFRTFIADDYGMLFLFGNEDKRTFWMKDTLIALDILFLARDGEIHHIHHNAKPQDLSKITSERDSYAVLEIKGGATEGLGISEGDTVLHTAFRNIVAE